jgi:hypothetical protein
MKTVRDKGSGEGKLELHSSISLSPVDSSA